jgi:hypothetical protein
VSGDELGRSVGRSVDQRVSRLRPRPDEDLLFEHVERSNQRRSRRFVVAIVMALALGVGVGALLFPRSSSEPTREVLAPADGVPGPQPPTATFEPTNPDSSRAAITSAFRDAVDGGVPEADRIAATQAGAALVPLHDASERRAAQFGYTAEQLAASTVEVLDVSYIDSTHAVVKFTLTIPGHGPVLVDRVGYAIVDGGRWKVALRTSCDLLSLSGLGQECPPPA